MKTFYYSLATIIVLIVVLVISAFSLFGSGLKLTDFSILTGAMLLSAVGGCVLTVLICTYAMKLQIEKDTVDALAEHKHKSKQSYSQQVLARRERKPVFMSNKGTESNGVVLQGLALYIQIHEDDTLFIVGKGHADKWYAEIGDLIIPLPDPMGAWVYVDKESYTPGITRLSPFEKYIVYWDTPLSHLK